MTLKTSLPRQNDGEYMITKCRRYIMVDVTISLIMGHEGIAEIMQTPKNICLISLSFSTSLNQVTSCCYT